MRDEESQAGGNLVQEEGEQISHIVWDNAERQAYKVRLTSFLMSTLGLWLVTQTMACITL